MSVELAAKFADQNDLQKDPSILQKYQKAGEIATSILKVCILHATPGTSISFLCHHADKLIVAQTQSCGAKESGVALPTTVCVNNCVSNYAPLPCEAGDEAQDLLLRAGDLAKIELGVHIDGYVATAAHTFFVGTGTAQNPVSGPAADAVIAAWTAAVAVERMLRVGVHTNECTAIINKIARMFNCTPVEGTQSSQMKRFLLDAPKVIENSIVNDAATVRAIPNYVLEAGDVFAVNIVMSSGAGKRVEQTAVRTTIFNRDVTAPRFDMKLAASRQLLAEVDARFGVFPFSMASVAADGDGSCAKVRLGLPECLQRRFLRVNPVFFDGAGAYVAQFKFTAIVKENMEHEAAVGSSGCERITAFIPPPVVISRYTLQKELLASAHPLLRD